MNAVLRVRDGAEGFAYLVLQAALDRYGMPPAELTPAEYGQALAQAERAAAIQRKVLARPEAQTVVVAESAVDGARTAIASRYDTPAAFAEDLVRNGLDEAGLRAALARELRVGAAIEQAAGAAAQVSDTEVEIYYWQHPDKFRRPERRSARHILITVNDDFPENRRETARARIDAIAAELAGDPTRFGAVARRFSECPTAMEGGRLGTMPAGQLYPELDAVLFALPEGCMSAVVESPIGFHLLWCEAVQPEQAVPLETAQERVRAHLEQRKRRLALRSWLIGGD